MRGCSTCPGISRPRTHTEGWVKLDGDGTISQSANRPTRRDHRSTPTSCCLISKCGESVSRTDFEEDLLSNSDEVAKSR